MIDTFDSKIWAFVDTTEDNVPSIVYSCTKLCPSLIRASKLIKVVIINTEINKASNLSM